MLVVSSLTYSARPIYTALQKMTKRRFGSGRGRVERSFLTGAAEAAEVIFHHMAGGRQRPSAGIR
jgi:hypothetical protein